jgi:hypothetical protein
MASGSWQPMRAKCQHGKRERGELPPPNLSLPDRKVGQGLFFLQIGADLAGGKTGFGLTAKVLYDIKPVISDSATTST